MAFLAIAGSVLKGVVKVGAKVGGIAVKAIKKGIAKRKEKKAAKKGLDPVANTTQELVDGSAKYYRELLNEQKDKMRSIDEKIRFAKKLMNAGMTESEARAKVGLSDQDKKLSVESWLDAAEEETPQINLNQSSAAGAARQGCAWLTLLILTGGGALVTAIITLTIYLF